MTDPTADAARLLPAGCSVPGCPATGDGKPYAGVPTCMQGYAGDPAAYENHIRGCILRANTRPQPAPPEGEPVAWAVKDFADGWIIFDTEDRARISAETTGALVVRLGLAARPKVEDSEWLKTTTLYAQWRDVTAKLAEREAELAKADAVINWFDDYCGPSFRELAGEFLIAKFEASIQRHAARQQPTKEKL